MNGYTFAALTSRRRSADAAVKMRVEVDVSVARVNDVLGVLDDTYRESDVFGTAVFSALKDAGLFMNATELVFGAATREETDATNVASTSLSTGLFAAVVVGAAIIILVIVIVVSSRRASRKVRASQARLSAYNSLMSPFEDGHSRRTSGEQMPRPSGLSYAAVRQEVSRESDYGMLDEHLGSGAAMMADADMMRELRAASRVSSVHAWDDSITDVDETRVTYQNPVGEWLSSSLVFFFLLSILSHWSSATPMPGMAYHQMLII